MDIDSLLDKPVNKNRDIGREVDELYGGGAAFRSHLHSEMGVSHDGRVIGGENRRAGFGMGGFDR